MKYTMERFKSDREHNTTIWMVYVIMTFVLAVLKLTGYIGITWLWVFSPIWLPPAIVISVSLGIIALTLAVATIIMVLSLIVIGSKTLWEMWCK